MASRLTERTFEELAAVLAAKEPVPGGGGAAALVGALGAALCSMVGNYTLGKKTYAEVQDDVTRMLAEAVEVRLRLIELVQEDANAFVPLSRAYAIPRDDPKRADILEECTKQAITAPLEMMRQCCRAIDLLEEMAQKGSRMLLSDVACGAYFARAALEAASVNVFVNTRSLQDRAFARTVEDECDAMLATYAPRAETCANDVVAKLRG